MTRLILVLIGLSVVILTFGLSGYYGLDAKGTIDISLISIWLFAWIGEKKEAMWFAIFLGVIFDLISFTPFGFWLIIFVGSVLIIDWLKINFLTISSFFQAIAVLVLITLITHLLTFLLLGNFNRVEILFSILFNVLLGSIMYYLLAIKLKMFQRWSGKIL